MSVLFVLCKIYYINDIYGYGILNVLCSSLKSFSLLLIIIIIIIKTYNRQNLLSLGNIVTLKYY